MSIFPATSNSARNQIVWQDTRGSRSSTWIDEDAEKSQPGHDDLFIRAGNEEISIQVEGHSCC
jgi:hypothetical protein